MKKTFVCLTILVVFSALASAQVREKEAELLRDELNIAANQTILIDRGKSFPARKPLRVFAAIKQSAKEAKKFGKWLKKWNKKNGNKYGKIEIVDKLENADVVVAQFRTVAPVYVKEVVTKVGNISSTGEIRDNVRVGVGYGYRRMDLPTHSYLLVKSNRAWVIVFRNVEPIFVEEQMVNPRARLRGAMSKKLKNRK